MVSEGPAISRFKETTLDECPYGYGVEKICLDPYNTVAADLETKGKDGKPLHKVGDVIFVPSMVGVQYAGKVHDGYFTVRDRGGAIDGPDRYDFFTGPNCDVGNSNPFAKKGLGRGKPKKGESAPTPIPYQVIQDPTLAAQVRGRRLYPSVPPITYTYRDENGKMSSKTLGGGK